MRFRTDNLRSLLEQAESLGAATVSLDVVTEDVPTALLTPPEVARRYRVSPDTVRGWIKSGELKAIKIGKRRLHVTADALADFDRRRETAKLPAARRRSKRPKLLVNRYAA